MNKKIQQNLDYLKASGRWPKQKVNDVSVPKAQVTTEEYGKLVETISETATVSDDASFNAKEAQRAIYGREYLKDVALYDSDATAVVSGNSVKMTKITDATGNPFYGIELPSLQSGKKYRVMGTVKNGTALQLNVATTDSLWADGATKVYLKYHIEPGETHSLDAEFTYSTTTKYIVFEPFVGLNKTVEYEIYLYDGNDIISRLSDIEGDDPANSKLVCLNSDVKAGNGDFADLLNTFDTKQGFSVINESDCTRITASGYSGLYKYEGELPLKKYNFEHGKKYALYIDMISDALPLLNTFDTFELTLYFVKPDYTSDSVNFIIKAGEIIATGKWRNVQNAFKFTAPGSADYQSIRARLCKFNNTSTTNKILDVKIKSFMFFKLPSAFEDMSSEELIALVKNTGEWTSLPVATSLRHPYTNLLYDGLKLKSLGDSLPETLSFQPFIAQHFGMKYNSSEEITSENVTWNNNYVYCYRSVYGSTRVVPAIVGTTENHLGANDSVFMRAKSLKYRNPDVIIVLAGYNDTHAGYPYIAGGTYVVPADYGLNDAPYTGGEIDLVSDPTQVVPSFGASYRGMLEQIFTDMPWARVILCGIPRGADDVSLIGTTNDWVSKKNLVIEKIASEYGCSFVDLSKCYGANAKSVKWLTKDNLHFSDFGGRRVAQEIIAHCF